MNTIKPSAQTGDTNLVLFAGRYPKDVKPKLLQAVDALGYKILPASIGAFKSGERFCELYPKQEELFAQNKDQITGAHVHIVMHMYDKPDKFFVDAINTAETIAGQNPASLHMIMPFAPFARQDRDFDKRMVSKMAHTLPKHLKCAGVDHVTTFDVHSKSAEAFYVDAFGEENVQFLSAVDHLRAAAQKLLPPEAACVVGAPDGGDKPDDVAQRKARTLRNSLYNSVENAGDRMFFITKQHVGINETKVMKLAGDVAGKTALLLDDMVDTGGTLVNGANALKQHDAKACLTLFTHPILSGDSLSRLTSPTIAGQPNPIDFIVTADTITSIHDKVRRLPTQSQKERVKIVSTLPLIKQALAHKF